MRGMGLKRRPWLATVPLGEWAIIWPGLLHANWLWLVWAPVFVLVGHLGYCLPG